MIISLPIWSIILCQIGSLFNTITMGTHAPMYLYTMLSLSVTTCGLLGGLKNLLLIIFSIVFTQIIDYLLTQNKLSKTNVRKIAGFIEAGVQGTCVLVMSISNDSPTLMIIWITLASMLSGASSSGTFPNIIDITPNFADNIIHITNTLTSIIGFISPCIVGLINNVSNHL